MKNNQKHSKNDSISTPNIKSKTDHQTLSNSKVNVFDKVTSALSYKLPKTHNKPPSLPRIPAPQSLPDFQSITSQIFQQSLVKTTLAANP